MMRSTSVAQVAAEAPAAHRVIHVPIIAVIVCAMLVSTSSSIAGGLLIYFQGLKSLEEAVEQTSKSEVTSLAARLDSVDGMVLACLGQLKQFFYSQKQINGTDTEEWVDRMNALFFAQVNASSSLYFAALMLHPYSPRHNATFVYATVWSDLSRDGSRNMLVADAGPHFLPNNVGGNMMVRAFAMNRTTGNRGKFLYNWTSKIRGYEDDGVTYTIDPASDTIADGPGLRYGFTRGRLVADAHAEAKRGPRLWHTPPDFLYSYHSLDAVYHPPDPPHPWHAQRAVRISVGYLSKAFQDVMESHQRVGGTEILLVSRSSAPSEDGRVLATTRQGYSPVPPECRGRRIQGEDAEYLGCFANITFHFPEVVQDAYRVLGNTPYGAFVRSDVGGTDHFLRREHVAGSRELIWICPASDVDGDVRESLWVLIAFSLLVLLFDTLVSLGELFFIALPLRRLASSINSIGRLQTDSAMGYIKSYQARTLMVKEISTLMAGMTDTILQLHEYRTFLPQSILAGGGSSSGASERRTASVATLLQRDAPCGDEVAVVFTDIRGSTKLWEACHSAMSDSLKLHNAVVRECIARHDGYEVKTIGDAFMVAFDTPDDAVMFSLNLQERLAEADWPNDLLNEPLCTRDPKGDWAGLRIRVGVAAGPVELQFDEVTGRFDYFGPTVNRAARMEGMSRGGTLGLETGLLDALSPATCRAGIVIPIGQQSLKGIAQPVNAALLVPASLSRRASCIQGELRQEDRDKTLDAPCRSPTPSLSTSMHGRGGLGLQIHSMTPALMATVGQLTQLLDLTHTSDGYQPNYLVTAAMSALERTEGSILTVTGCAVEVGWNVGPRACASHIESAFRFAGWINRSLGDDVRCGLSTGPMRTGSVGSQGQRFVAAIGGSALHAALTLYHSEDLGVRFIYTSDAGQTLTDLCNRGFVRPIGTRVIASSKLLIHQVNTVRVLQWCDDKLVPLLAKCEAFDNGVEPQEDGWGPAYCEAFHACDVGELLRIAEKDTVVSGVHARLVDQPSNPLCVVSSGPVWSAA